MGYGPGYGQPQQPPPPQPSWGGQPPNSKLSDYYFLHSSLNADTIIWGKHGINSFIHAKCCKWSPGLGVHWRQTNSFFFSLKLHGVDNCPSNPLVIHSSDSSPQTLPPPPLTTRTTLIPVSFLPHLLNYHIYLRLNFCCNCIIQGCIFIFSWFLVCPSHCCRCRKLTSACSYPHMSWTVFAHIRP